MRWSLMLNNLSSDSLRAERTIFRLYGDEILQRISKLMWSLRCFWSLSTSLFCLFYGGINSYMSDVVGIICWTE